MKTRLLGDICEVNPRTDANLEPAQACSFVPMEYVDDRFGIITRQDTRTVREVGSGYTFFKDGDVLFAKITPCMENGKAAVARGLVNGIGFGSTEFHVVRPSKGVLPELIFHFLRQARIRKYAARRMTGSAGQQRVPSIVLEELEVHLPDSIEDQEPIAAALNNADRLRRTRRYAQQLSDTFLQSVFIKMFGDDLKNQRRAKPLGELVTISGGGTPSRGTSSYFTGTIAWVTAKDMRGDYISDAQEHITEEAVKKSATKIVPAGTILVVVKSKVLMHRLPLAITRRALCHNQDLKSIQCSDTINPYFLFHLLRYNEPQLLRQARGANTEGLNLDMLEGIPVPDIPLPDQERFASIVQRFDHFRAQQREATRRAEHLFQTLLHKAFNKCL